MIKNYLIERRSWILLFLVLQIFVLFVAYIDVTIPFSSMLYLVFLSSIIFVFFLGVRYKKETAFYKNLGEWRTDLDLTSLSKPNSPFEEIITSVVIEQTENLKKEATQNLMTLEQEKDDLLAWIHEVKTPLTAMHLMFERLDDKKLKEQLIFEWLRIHLLLDQQLHHNRITYIENDLYIENIEMENVINKEIKALQSWCMQKGIGFEVDLQVTNVLSDAKWLAFIMRQLLTNAIKYSEHADILIKSYHKNGQAYLQIQDFGRGIDQRDVSRIFDKGFTSTSNHHDSASTGMGLYLAKKAALSLLIDIGVQSKLGEGTIFTLSFPTKNEFTSITSM